MRAAGTRLWERVTLGAVVLGTAWLALPRATWAQEDSDEQQEVSGTTQPGAQSAQSNVRCVPDNSLSSADTGRALQPGVVAVPAPSGGGQIICVPQPNAMGLNEPQTSGETGEQREPVAGREQGAECGNRVIYFATGSATLDENAKELLRQSARCLGSVGVAGRLGQSGSTDALGLSVVGGTDPRGSSAMNRRLGERRAEAVRRFLGEQGLSSEQITAATVGEDQPVCNDRSADCLARNRRAVIRVEPQGAMGEPPPPGERTPHQSPDEELDQSPGQP